MPDYRERGFVLPRMRALNECAFARSSIRRITAKCLDYSVASLKVLEKLGMRRLGSAGETLYFELRKR
jgi:RimJ/RimL family protein N-acetyltransferase